MGLLDRLFGGVQRGRAASAMPSVASVKFDLPGWTKEMSKASEASWRDAVGDLLALYVGRVQPPPALAAPAIQLKGRKLAESSGAGLVEAVVVSARGRRASKVIYKRRQGAGFLFVGMLTVPTERTDYTWTMVAGERGTTGVREAVVTQELLDDGRLTLESYQSGWAEDPYDPAYKGVTRENLRCMSDDELYDARFPQHPLSRIRRTLREVADSVEYQEPGA